MHRGSLLPWVTVIILRAELENCGAICSPTADTESAARLLPSAGRAGKTSPLDLNHFCSLRKWTLLGKSTAEYKMYRKKTLKWLDKLNPVTYRLSLKQRDKREKKKKNRLNFQLPLVWNTVNLAKSTVNSVCSPPAKKFRLVSGMFLECSEYAVGCIGR